jgi:putative heme-binding domain-containing protein
VRHLAFALRAVGSPAVVKPLVELLRGNKVPAGQSEGILAVIAALGGPSDLALVLEQVLGGTASISQRAVLLNALTQATRQRGVRPSGDLAGLEKLFGAEDDKVREAAARAAGLWQVESLRPRLLDLARGATTLDGLRQAAFEGLAALGGPQSRAAFEGLTGAGQPAQVRRKALIALADVDPLSAAQRAADVLADTPAGQDTIEVFRAFLQHRRGAALLAAALADRKLPPDVAKVGVRMIRTSGRDAPDLLDVLGKSVGLTPGPRVLSPAELKQLVADVQAHGNAARGEEVYRRADMACLKCHAIAGAGGQVGPDLSSLGASAPVDYLVEAILQPNKAIKENYHSTVVTTKDGKLVTGIKVRQTDRELILRDAEDREVAVPLAVIDEQGNGPSLMPEGQADPLTRTELVDLLRFLSELGKVGPYAVSPARVVRRWQVLTPNKETYTLLSRTSFASAAGNHAALVWTPAYSTVAGALPLDAVPPLEFRKPVSKDVHRVGFVRCQLEATTPGKVRLRLNAAMGFQAWLDGAPVDVKDVMELDLKTGVQTLTIVIDLAARREMLRCELEDAPGSPARARVMAGK